jgi:ribose 5-phosphate isomerase A
VSNNKIEDPPAITDNGNYIVDIQFLDKKVIKNPSILAADLKSIVGVVEHGLFCGMVHQLIVATKQGTTRVHGTATPSEYTPPFRPWP